MLDFVEAPSQMLEDGCSTPRCSSSGEVHSYAPVPADLLAKGSSRAPLCPGLFLRAPTAGASFDLALHSDLKPDPTALMGQDGGAPPLGHVAGALPGRLLPTWPAGGAGHYAYLWSLVQAMDMHTAFAADKLSPEVGARYREQVLAQGSCRPRSWCRTSSAGPQTARPSSKTSNASGTVLAPALAPSKHHRLPGPRPWRVESRVGAAA